MIFITIHIITCFICTCDFTLKRSTCMTKIYRNNLVVKERERVPIVYDFGLKFSQEVNQQNFGHLKLATQ